MPRELERTSVSLDIILEWSSGKQEARVSDLSLGGCYIDCIANVRQGEIVSFKVNVAEGNWVELRGEVAYALGSFGFGVRFVDLSPEETALIEYLILTNNGNPWKIGEEGKQTENPA